MWCDSVHILSMGPVDIFCTYVLLSVDTPSMVVVIPGYSVLLPAEHFGSFWFVSFLVSFRKLKLLPSCTMLPVQALLLCFTGSEAHPQGGAKGPGSWSVVQLHRAFFYSSNPSVPALTLFQPVTL